MSPDPTAVESAPRTARALARTQLTRAILTSARRQLAQVGPAQLSVRAVARDLGMVSSAVYRYFPSRDELLTALIAGAYDELGDAAERAERAVIDRGAFDERWAALTAATRHWALAHPHDFALLFGSPVPGYAAPRATVEPAQRITKLLANLVCDIAEAGAAPAGTIETSAGEHAALAGIREFAGADLTDTLVLRLLRAWSGLIGSLTLELYGHFTGGIDDVDSAFAALSRSLYPGADDGGG